MGSAWQRAADRLGLAFDMDRVLLYGSLGGVDVSVSVASRSLALDELSRGPGLQRELTIARARFGPPLDADLELEQQVIAWQRARSLRSPRAISIVERALPELVALGSLRFDGWLDDSSLRLETEGMASDEEWLVDAALATSAAGQALHAARMHLPVRPELEGHVHVFDTLVSELGLQRSPSALGAFGMVGAVGAMAHAHSKRRGVEPWELMLRTAAPNAPPFPLQVVKKHASFLERHHLLPGGGSKTGDAELDAHVRVIAGDAEQFLDQLGPARDDLIALLALDQLGITGSVVTAVSARFEEAGLLARAARVSAALAGVLGHEAGPYR